jgi:hypothetical protein
VTKYDTAIGETIRQAKQVPVLINYTAGKKRHEKTPDAFDGALIGMIEGMEIPYWYPSSPMMFKKGKWGDTWRAGTHFGITHVHHFYTKRNLWTLAALWSLCPISQKFSITNIISRNATRLNRFIINQYNPKGRINGPMTGTLYIPSEQVEQNILQLFMDKNLKVGWNNSGNLISTSSLSAKVERKTDLFDFIFLDPPFGANIMYSELNFLWESWLNVWTNNISEAIENATQNKGIDEYRKIMTSCFREAYSLLKPGRWITIEFSNTRAGVWNNIQSALNDAGFIVANVSILDKKHGGIKSMLYSTTVKQDLVISAYKPNGGFEERFVSEATTEEGVWDFVKTHLKYLPVTKMQGKDLVQVPERDPRILFDQMVAYYVRKGYLVPISSPEFQIGLKQRFIDRDGMYFLPKQVSEYDKKKLSGASIAQTTLFVTDEASAIQWLRLHLKERPQTFQEVHPEFIQETQRGWSKNEVGLELSTLLEQNFLKYDGKGEVPSQIHGYLSSNWKECRNLPKDDPALKKKAIDRWYVPDPNKAADLEKIRERALLREFEGYRGDTKRLKLFRIEAVRAGFKKAWQEKDYRTIIDVANRIPPKVLEEDPKLLMWYDQAVTRSGE